MRKILAIAVAVAFVLSAMPLFAAESTCAKCGQSVPCEKCPKSSFQAVADTFNCLKAPPRGCGQVPKLIKVPPQDVTIFSDAAKDIQKIDKCNCSACRAARGVK
jgi:hypothetical protein